MGSCFRRNDNGRENETEGRSDKVRKQERKENVKEEMRRKQEGRKKKGEKMETEWRG